MKPLDYIIENELFIVCSLEPTDRFIKYCSLRGINTSREQLEQFERLGLFYPMARVRHPQTYFWFRTDHAKLLLADGKIWDPSQRPFEPWETFKDSQKQKQVESFYSIFQGYHLHRLLQATSLTTIRAEKLIGNGESQNVELVRRLQSRAEEVIAEQQAVSNPRAAVAAIVCQAISNRYFPNTQSDRRTIRISSGHTVGEWDWFDYQRRWEAKSVLADLDIELEVLKQITTMVKVDANNIDPLERWSELVSFVAVDKRNQLKGTAQFGQALRSMGAMLSKFHEDITGIGIHLFEESPQDVDSFYGGTGVTADNLEYLEYLANEYHLNPRPKLILVVEGHGEEEQLPRLSEEVFGLTFSHCEIEVRNLNGIGAFTGDKKRDKYGALEKFIDFNHDRQTIVFAILDDEDRALEVKNKLISKLSDYHPKRTVTREEYITIWNGCIEFANFTDGEIAAALTDLCNGDYVFQPADIAAIRGTRKGNPLKDLFNSKTGGKYDLNKRHLLGKLFDPIVAMSEHEFNAQRIGDRPIMRTLQTVLWVANRNYQPESRDAWTENQDSGFFGHTKGEAERRTKESLSNVKFLASSPNPFNVCTFSE